MEPPVKEFDFDACTAKIRQLVELARIKDEEADLEELLKDVPPDKQMDVVMSAVLICMDAGITE